MASDRHSAHRSRRLGRAATTATPPGAADVSVAARRTPDSKVALRIELLRDRTAIVIAHNPALLRCVGRLVRVEEGRASEAVGAAA